MKLLLALDHSPHSRRAADYVAGLAPRLTGCEVILFSVLSGIPYGPEELAAGQPLAPTEVHGDEDQAKEVLQIRAFLEEIASVLHGAGVPAGNVRVEMKPLRRGIAQDIIDEANANSCDTIVVGRRGLSRVRELITGSVSRDLVQKPGTRAIWIVE